MKLIILCLFLTGCGSMTVSPELYASSYHTRKATAAGHKYNQFNPGAGLHVGQSKQGLRFGGRAATYRNSIDRQSVYGAGTAEYCIGNEWHSCFGAMAGLVSGYGAIKPLAAPVVGLGYDRVTLNLTAFPIAKGHGLGVSGWVSYKLMEF